MSVLCSGFKFHYRPRRENVLLSNSILWLKGGVQTEQERQLEQTEDKMCDLTGKIMVLVQTHEAEP